MPPYWFRHRCHVDSMTSRWRATSSIDYPWPRSFPPSANFQTICSGVCRRRFIVCCPPSPHRGPRTRTTGGSAYGDPVSDAVAEHGGALPGLGARRCRTAGAIRIAVREPGRQARRGLVGVPWVRASSSPVDGHVLSQVGSHRTPRVEGIRASPPVTVVLLVPGRLRDGSGPWFALGTLAPGCTHDAPVSRCSRRGSLPMRWNSSLGRRASA